MGGGESGDVVWGFDGRIEKRGVGCGNDYGWDDEW